MARWPVESGDIGRPAGREDMGWPTVAWDLWERMSSENIYSLDPLIYYALRRLFIISLLLTYEE